MEVTPGNDFAADFQGRVVRSKDDPRSDQGLGGRVRCRGCFRDQGQSGEHQCPGEQARVRARHGFSSMKGSEGYWFLVCESAPGRTRAFSATVGARPPRGVRAPDQSHGRLAREARPGRIAGAELLNFQEVGDHGIAPAGMLALRIPFKNRVQTKREFRECRVSSRWRPWTSCRREVPRRWSTRGGSTRSSTSAGLSAIDGICPHQGGPLAEGDGLGDDGDLPVARLAVRPPERQDPAGRSKIKQAVFEVKVEGQDVLVAGPLTGRRIADRAILETTVADEGRRRPPGPRSTWRLHGDALPPVPQR